MAAAIRCAVPSSYTGSGAAVTGKTASDGPAACAAAGLPFGVGVLACEKAGETNPASASTAKAKLGRAATPGRLRWCRDIQIPLDQAAHFTRSRTRCAFGEAWS